MSKLILYTLIGFFSSTSLSILNPFQLKSTVNDKFPPFLDYIIVLTVIVNLLYLLFLKVKTIKKFLTITILVSGILFLQILFRIDSYNKNSSYIYSLILLNSLLSTSKEALTLSIIEKIIDLVGYFIGKIGFIILISYVSSNEYFDIDNFLIYLLFILKTVFSFIFIYLLKKFYEKDYFSNQKNQFLICKNNCLITYQSDDDFFNRTDYFFSSEMIIKSKSVFLFLYKNMGNILINHVFNYVYIIVIKGLYVFFIILFLQKDDEIYKNYLIYNSNKANFKYILFASIQMMVGIIVSVVVNYFIKETKHSRLVLYFLLLLNIFLVLALFYELNIYFIDIRIIYRVLYSCLYTLNIYEIINNSYIINKTKEVSLVIYLISSSIPFIIGFYLTDSVFFLSFDNEI